MKISLIVVDFDKTLLPFDSFRAFLLFWLKKYPLRMGFYILLRKLRLISSGELKRKTILLVTKHSRYQEFTERFAEKMCNAIDKELLKKLQEKSTGNTQMLLLSASPHDYIALVSRRLGMTGQGSHLLNDAFVHMHGSEKTKYITNRFPATHFIYSYAISDCESDLSMVSMFDKYDLLPRK